MSGKGIIFEPAPYDQRFSARSLLYVYAVGHCSLIFLTGLYIGFMESMLQARGVKVFSRYFRIASDVVLVAAGI